MFRTLMMVLALFAARASLAVDPDPYDRFRGIDENDQDFHYDSNGDAPWAEQAIDKPPAPNPKALRPLDLESAPRGFQVLIDSSSIGKGEYDDVLRYWLVLKSTHGAMNYSYEGMRCGTGEYKLYGYAMPDGGHVRPYARPAWKPLRATPGGRYRIELKNDYLCNGAVPRPPVEIRALVAGHDKQEIDPYAELLD